ncbi:hypothetical protein CROQUDRAFT_99503 [Cronartium quercuum f. sp. fusiforme G11]|uniref:Uncharacterized protein n=1 Tax=Cronartium quercuum f. sp. fusiforme G11 TaxID=708437 RepID=A0A9P6NAX5_9BASI|nr:hypothetical protein CROQUDRAFT_99503 [Cronartium quercuum f. sp. fusiforme G11]
MINARSSACLPNSTSNQSLKSHKTTESHSSSKFFGPSTTNVPPAYIPPSYDYLQPPRKKTKVINGPNLEVDSLTDADADADAEGSVDDDYPSVPPKEEGVEVVEEEEEELPDAIELYRMKSSNVPDVVTVPSSSSSPEEENKVVRKRRIAIVESDDDEVTNDSDTVEVISSKPIRRIPVIEDDDDEEAVKVMSEKKKIQLKELVIERH